MFIIILICVEIKCKKVDNLFLLKRKLSGFSYSCLDDLLSTDTVIIFQSLGLMMFIFHSLDQRMFRKGRAGTW